VLVVSFWAFCPACGTPHSRRHWYGTNLVATGADLRTAQTLLRHANLQTTAIYVQVADGKRSKRSTGLTRVGEVRARAQLVDTSQIGPATTLGWRPEPHSRGRGPPW
jgi:hypothetical protein